MGKGGVASRYIALGDALSFFHGEWRHLGVAVDNRSGAARIKVYVDGIKLDEFRFGGPAFELQAGALVVGATGGHPGVRAWIDEFKILAEEPAAEVICNHAKGTLLGVSSGDPLFELAGAYPVTTHQEISQALTAAGHRAYPRYICERQTPPLRVGPGRAAHTDLQCIGKLSVPSEMPHPQACLRAALLFPEGPLRIGVPRPDSSANAFCHSCHEPGHPVPGLGLAALAPNGELKEHDRRRQPLESSALIFGNVPAGLLNAQLGLPTTDLDAADGLLTDLFVYAPASR